MIKTYATSFEDGAEINVTVSDEPWRGDVNVTDQEATTEGLLPRAACQKCGRSAPTVETERLFLHELSMKDLPVLRAFLPSAREDRYLSGDQEGPRDEAFLRRYIEAQYVFLDYSPWVLFRHDRKLHETRLLGLIEFSPEEPPELGYILRLEARGQGYAAEAESVALYYAGTEFGFTAVKTRIVPENRAGCAVVVKIEEQRNRADGAPQCRLLVKHESSVYKS